MLGSNVNVHNIYYARLFLYKNVHSKLLYLNVNFLKKKHFLNPQLPYRKVTVPTDPARRIKEIF